MGRNDMNICPLLLLNGLQGSCWIEGSLWHNHIAPPYIEEAPEVAISTNMKKRQDHNMFITRYHSYLENPRPCTLNITPLGIDGTARCACRTTRIENEERIFFFHPYIRFLFRRI